MLVKGATGNKLLHEQILIQIHVAIWRHKTTMCPGWTICEYGPAIGAIGIVFWYSLCGVERMCWTTGSWRCRLSQKDVRSILTLGMTIYMYFLWSYMFYIYNFQKWFKYTSGELCVVVVVYYNEEGRRYVQNIIPQRGILAEGDMTRSPSCIIPFWTHSLECFLVFIPCLRMWACLTHNF